MTLLMAIVTWVFLGTCIVIITILLEQDFVVKDLLLAICFGVIWPIYLIVYFASWLTNSGWSEKTLLRRFRSKREE